MKVSQRLGEAGPAAESVNSRCLNGTRNGWGASPLLVGLSFFTGSRRPGPPKRNRPARVRGFPAVRAAARPQGPESASLEAPGLPRAGSSLAHCPHLGPARRTLTNMTESSPDAPEPDVWTTPSTTKPPPTHSRAACVVCSWRGTRAIPRCTGTGTRPPFQRGVTQPETAPGPGPQPKKKKARRECSRPPQRDTWTDHAAGPVHEPAPAALVVLAEAVTVCLDSGLLSNLLDRASMLSSAWGTGCHEHAAQRTQDRNSRASPKRRTSRRLTPMSAWSWTPKIR